MVTALGLVLRAATEPGVEGFELEALTETLLMNLGEVTALISEVLLRRLEPLRLAVMTTLVPVL